MVVIYTNKMFIRLTICVEQCQSITHHIKMKLIIIAFSRMTPSVITLSRVIIQNNDGCYNDTLWNDTLQIDALYNDTQQNNTPQNDISSTNWPELLAFLLNVTVYSLFC